MTKTWPSTWVKVLDELARRCRPRASRGPAAETARVVIAGWIDSCTKTSIGERAREGRVVLRRLNRRQYENTLRDLLATPVEVKACSRTTVIAAGFDNVSRFLDISPVHLLQLPDTATAEKAVQAVVQARPQVRDQGTPHGAWSPRSCGFTRSYSASRGARLDGDALILYLRNQTTSTCYPLRGARRTDGTALRMRIRGWAPATSCR